MKPEGRERVREVLEAARELPPDRRTAFLDQACASEPELRKEVDSLLLSGDEAETFLKELSTAPQKALRPLGRIISHYEILEKLGSGGMGDVYIAEDTKLGRKVALKVLPPRFADSPDLRRRFEQEARAVAALSP